MGSGISRLSPLASCGPYGRKTSDLNDKDGDPSTKKLIPKNNNDDEQQHVDCEDKKISSSLSAPAINIVKEKEEEKGIEKVDVINNDQEEMEEGEGINSDYEGPLFMKSPSFRDFVRPSPPPQHSVHDNLKKDGIKEEETKKTEAKPNNVRPDQVCTREENKKETQTPEMNKEGGAKEKKIYKIFLAAGGMKNLFHVNCYNPKATTNSS